MILHVDVIVILCHSMTSMPFIVKRERAKRASLCAWASGNEFGHFADLPYKTLKIIKDSLCWCSFTPHLDALQCQDHFWSDPQSCEAKFRKSLLGAVVVVTQRKEWIPTCDPVACAKFLYCPDSQWQPMTVNQAKCLKNDVSGYWSCPDETNLVWKRWPC